MPQKGSRQAARALLLSAVLATGVLAAAQAAAQPDIASISRRGNNYSRLGEHDLAIAEFNAALRIDPGYTFALLGRAHAYLGQGDEVRALQDFNAVLQTVDANWYAPLNQSDAHIGRGRVALRRRAYDQAIADFNEALQRHRMSAVAYAYRAEALLGQAKTAEALADVARALWVDPNYGLAYQIRSRIHLAGDRPLEAADDAMRASLFEAFDETRWLLVRGRDRTRPVDDSTDLGPGPPSPIPLGHYYSSISQSCPDDARHVLWISMGAGSVAVRPMYAAAGGRIAVLEHTSGMTFVLGDEGCRIKVTIGKGTDGSAAQPAQSIEVARDAAPPLFEHRFFDPSPACVPATVRVRAFWGYVDVTDESLVSPTLYRWNNPPPPPGIDSHRFGDAGCEIEIRTSKAD